MKNTIVKSIINSNMERNDKILTFCNVVDDKTLLRFLAQLAVQSCDVTLEMNKIILLLKDDNYQNAAEAQEILNSIKKSSHDLVLFQLLVDVCECFFIEHKFEAFVTELPLFLDDVSDADLFNTMKVVVY